MNKAKSTATIESAPVSQRFVELWSRRTSIIAILAVIGILLHLFLRFWFEMPAELNRIPLLVLLVVGATVGF